MPPQPHRFLSLSFVEMVMFGWDFEVDARSRFWRCLIKICVWTCDMTSRSYFGKMNSTFGSVVPLAMFIILIAPGCLWLGQGFMLMRFPTHDGDEGTGKNFADGSAYSNLVRWSWWRYVVILLSRVWMIVRFLVMKILIVMVVRRMRSLLMTVQIQMRLGEWANKHQGDPIWGQGAALDDI